MKNLRLAEIHKHDNNTLQLLLDVEFFEENTGLDSPFIDVNIDGNNEIGSIWLLDGGMVSETWALSDPEIEGIREFVKNLNLDINSMESGFSKIL